MVAAQDVAKESLQLAPLRVAIVGGPAHGEVIELADPRTAYCQHFNNLCEGMDIKAVPILDGENE